MSEVDDMLFEEADVAPVEADEGRLTIDIDGWEGPLDVLLSLARTQKVDLRQISILQLVEQYLGFIENARTLKLELALRLQLRLERLNAMRESGARLMARDRIGRDIFLRGEPEGLRVVRTTAWDVSYFELISAYGQMQARTAPVLHVVKRRAVMTLEEALERVSAMIGQMLDWTALEAFLPCDASPQLRRSALASSFLAMLELAKRGTIDLMQEASFSPLLVKAKKKEMQPC